MLPTSDYLIARRHRWDTYFLDICRTISKKSSCLSRKIGSIIVKDHSIISTGYNGPPRGVAHCIKRFDLNDKNDPFALLDRVTLNHDQCPRQSIGYKSGEGLHLCPASHAEANAIVNAARVGTSCVDSALYLNTCLPCKNCMSLIINAGIKTIVCYEGEYDTMSLWLAEQVRMQILRYGEAND